MKPKTTAQINEIFRRHYIPFVVDCNEKGEVKFYRIKEGSCQGEQITTRVTEESVAKWLEKIPKRPSSIILIASPKRQ